MKKTKPFSIDKQLVMYAFQMVKANRGSGGVDGVSLKMFCKDYKDYLYKLWNQMSSGSYIPPPVRLKEIAKKGGGMRPLGIPTVSDRVGQTVVKVLLENTLEKLFHEDSYGYRPLKSAADALAAARTRCWKYDWVVDLDIKGFFDNIPHDLLMKAVRKHCDCTWMLLYIERWLVAPLQKENGEIVARTKGVPQGSVIGPILANLYLHYCMDIWLNLHFPECKFERYADDAIIHCTSERHANEVKDKLQKRMEACGLELHPVKTKIVYCKDSNRRGKYADISFDFLGYTFKPRMARNSYRGVWFTAFVPAVSKKAKSSMNEKMRDWTILRDTTCKLIDVVRAINPVLHGWINYYGKFYAAELVNFMDIVNVRLAVWARRKYKRLRTSTTKAIRWLYHISRRSPTLFAHWKFGTMPSAG